MRPPRRLLLVAALFAAASVDAAGAPTDDALGLQRVLVLRLALEDGAWPAPTEAEIGNATTAVTVHYRSSSYERTSWTWDVRGPYVLPASVPCDDAAALDDAAFAAADPDVDYRHIDRVVLAYNHDECHHSSATFGSVERSTADGLVRVSVARSLGSDGARWLTIAHELGHNLGLHHAGRADCLPSTVAHCRIDDRGDPADVMGSGNSVTSHFVAAHKARLGWIAATEIAVAAQGAVELVNVSLPDAGVRAIRFPGSIRPFGVPAPAPVLGDWHAEWRDGALRFVLLREDYPTLDYPDAGSLLLDGTFATAGGSRACVPESGWCFRVTEADFTVARVEILPDS